MLAALKKTRGRWKVGNVYKITDNDWDDYELDNSDEWWNKEELLFIPHSKVRELLEEYIANRYGDGFPPSSKYLD